MRVSVCVGGATCLALLLWSGPVRAQVLVGYLLGEKLSTPTFNMGFEVGANFSQIEGLGDANRMTSTVFGLFADWRFSKHVHLGGAVLPFASRGAEGLAPVVTGDPGIDGQTAGATMTRTLSYVEVPVQLKWAPQQDEGFRVGAGPSLGFVTGAHDRYETTTPAGARYVVEHDIGGQLPGLDVGLCLDVEYRLPMLSIAARYTHGLTDMRHDGAAEPSYTRVLTGTGRIYLGKKPKP